LLIGKAKGSIEVLMHLIVSFQPCGRNWYGIKSYKF